jgi:hypothetical protein
MLMIGNSPKGFPFRSKIIHCPERDDLRRMPCGKDRSQITEYKGLIAGGEKVAPDRKASKLTSGVN